MVSQYKFNDLFKMCFGTGTGTTYSHMELEDWCKMDSCQSWKTWSFRDT